VLATPRPRPPSTPFTCITLFKILGLFFKNSSLEFISTTSPRTHRRRESGKSPKSNLAIHFFFLLTSYDCIVRYQYNNVLDLPLHGCVYLLEEAALPNGIALTLVVLIGQMIMSFRGGI
jgi:hypothetical protein